MSTINMQTNQKFLELIYWLQNNDSKAVLAPKEAAERLFEHEVYIEYNKCKKKYKYSIYPPSEKKNKLRR